MEKYCRAGQGTYKNMAYAGYIIIIIIISFMQLGHLLTRSGLTYPEVSSKVYHDSFCQLGSSISLPWVIYFEAFYLHVVSSFSCIQVICPKLVLFLNMPVQRLKVAILPLDLPCSGPINHSGGILTTGKSHGKNSGT